MPIKHIWTDAQDTQIRRLRTEGASWDTIAAVLGVTRSTAIERGRRIGARHPPRAFVPRPEDPARDPLPAGHPRTWGEMNNGTALEGLPYPLPFFRR